MAISFSTAEGYIESAITSVGNDDYTAARRHHAQAVLAFAAIPDAGNDGASMRFERRIENVKIAIDDAEKAFNKDKDQARITRAVFRLR